MLSSLTRTTRPVFLSTTNRGFFIVVNQAEIAYRSFLGSNRIRLEPGLNLTVPLLHRTNRVDMRESGVCMNEIRCFTKDNVPVIVSGTLFHKVFDAEKALFGVQDYLESVDNVGQSSARAVIGRFDYDNAIKNRTEINDELRVVVADSIKEWGVDCTRFEMNVFEPQNEHVAKSLEKQMEAERGRRENELNTQAVVRTAEGARDSAKLNADAIYYATQKVSDAQRYDVEQITQAIINQIHEIKAAVPGLCDEKVLQFMLESKRLEHLQAIAKSSSNKTYFIDPKSAFPAVNTLLAEK
jgi:regulator of protease activity HflC (stomatin/prohibitin superfamily)